MEMKALCDVCGKPSTVHTCRFCGARVCPEHYDKSLGLCSRCAASIEKDRKRPKGFIHS